MAHVLDYACNILKVTKCDSSVDFLLLNMEKSYMTVIACAVHYDVLVENIKFL